MNFPLLIVLVTIGCTTSEESSTDDVKQSIEASTVINQEFSFPPNNTPVSKVFVFGRPIYVRQPFVIPQRDGGLEQLPGTPGFAPLSQVQKKRATGYEAANDLPYQPSQPKIQVEASEDPYMAEPESYVREEPKYPLPQCYTNKAGFMCCNKDLEQLMDAVYSDLAANNQWKNCNVQQLANKLQDKAQSKFDTDFETLAGVGDFASKTHFYSDLICKTEMEGRFMLAYATPNRHNKKPAPAYAEEQPYHTVFI